MSNTQETLTPPSAARNPAAKTELSSTSRAHFPEKSMHKEWNFLRGEGPSSSAMYYAEEKKGWKPGWKSMKPQSSINQDKERIQNNAVREERNAAIRVIRAEKTHECTSGEKFNPISGQQVKEGKWQPAVDPWQHQRVGMRPAATIAKMEPKPDASERSLKMAEVHEMRKARIATDGLSTTKRSGGTAADCLRWGS